MQRPRAPASGTLVLLGGILLLTALMVLLKHWALRSTLVEALSSGSGVGGGGGSGGSGGGSASALGSGIRSRSRGIHPLAFNKAGGMRGRRDEDDGGAVGDAAVFGKEELQFEVDNPGRQKDLGPAKWTKFSLPYFEYLDESLSFSNATMRSETEESRVVPPPPHSGAACGNCFKVVSHNPYIVVFDNMVTEREAKILISLGERSLTKSGVVGPAGARGVRTSSGTRLARSNPVVAALDARLLNAVNRFKADKAARFFRSGNSERLYLLRYRAEERYNGHTDHFGGIDGPTMRSFRAKAKAKLRDARAEGRSTEHIAQKRLDRAATFIVYLGDLPDGHGTTSFPLSSSLAPKSNNVTEIENRLSRFNARREDPCPGGAPSQQHDGPLQITPKLGRAVLFYSLFENGVADPFSLHAGCPVGQQYANETKWLVTKWFMVPLQ